MKKLLKVAVLVSGRGSNLQAIIDEKEAGRLPIEIVLVLSDKEDAYALVRARRHGIKTMFLNPKEYREREAYDREIVKILKEHKVELVVLAGYMRLLSPYFVNEFRWRIINIHPALLPSFPGLHGQRQALEYGVKVSGCTVHFVDEGCDTGPIILQEAVKVKEDDTEETLSARILKKEHKLLPKAILLFAKGRLKVCGRRVFILKKGR